MSARSRSIAARRKRTGRARFFELYADLPLAERQARSFAYALVNKPVYTYAEERLAGQIYQGCSGSGAVDVNGTADPQRAAVDPRWNDFAAVPAAARLVRERLPENAACAKHFGGGASPGHVCWDFGRLLRLGARGMIEDARKRGQETKDAKAREFYRGVEIVLEGLIEWAARHDQALRDPAEKAEPDRARELLEMADTCARVPAGPAETFREAVQSFLFQNVMGQENVMRQAL